MPTSGFLSDATIARLRTRVEVGMSARCSVLRRPATTTGEGGSDITGAPALVAGLIDLPCTFRPAATPVEAVSADAVKAATVFLVKFARGDFTAGAASILPSDRLSITHTVPGVESPLVLDVTGDQPKHGVELSRRVLATRVQAGGV